MALTGEFAFIEDALDELQDFVDFLENEIPTILANAVNQSLQLDDGTDLPDIIGRILDELNQSAQVTADIEEFLSRSSREASNQAAAVLEDLLDSIERNAQIVINNAARANQSLTDKVVESTDAVIEDSRSLFGKLQDKVTGFFSTANEQAVELFGENFSKVTGAIEQEIDAAQALTGVAIQKAQSATESLAESFQAEISKLPEELAESLGKSLLGPLSGILGFLDLFDTEKWADAFQIIDSIWKPLEDDPFIGPIIKVIAPDGVIGLGIIGVVAFMPFIASLVSMATTGVFAGPMELARQSSFARTRPTKLSMGEIRELVWRQDLTLSDAREHWHAAGYEEIWFDKILGLGETLLTANDVLTLWRRNIIDDSELSTFLSKVGYPEEKRDLLKQLTFAIPPVQDLVLFAVREVFQLERAQELGQLEGLPPDILGAYQDKFGGFGDDVEGSIRAFSEFAKQAGIAPEWAAAYWAAHWRLPGVQSLFSMVHRLNPDVLASRAEGLADAGLNVDNLAFDMDELQRVLKAQDFSPFFREKLTAIAFHPLTRVDVRRIHALGLISDEELVLRYREVGFSPSDANLMGEFTKAFNFREDEPDEQETKALTRAQVLTFMENGALSPDEAQAQLEAIGYTPDAAITFVSLRQADVLEDEIKLQLDVIRTRFKTEDINFERAGTLIDELGLPPLQKAKELSRLELELQRQEFHPSMGDLTKFVQEGILSRAEYDGALENIGVPKLWRDRYVVLNTGEEVQQPDTRQTIISIAEIDRLWDSDALTWQRYLDLLFSIGFSQDALEAALRDKQGGNITTPQGNYIRRKFA